MNIGIIDADLLDNGTRHPNLALMKISGYQKELGNNVVLLENYDDIKKMDCTYISKVFSYTKVPNQVLNHKNIVIGGTGFYSDGGKSLPVDIEHHMPDYDLYISYINKKVSSGKSIKYYKDYLDYSIGFTTRGCFRKCEFCVNKKYNRAVRHSPVSEFLDDKRPSIYLWDDNFLAYSKWESILDELEDTNKTFQFRQGLDIRLLTKKSAERFANTKYKGDFIFAFDHIEDRALIEDKLQLWRRYSNRTTKLFLLCGYDSQDKNDIENTFKRIKILMKYGCLPYIMRYESVKDTKYRTFYTQIARWCNQPNFFKKKSFRQFCEANQDYHKNKNTNCSAYQSMIEFQKEFPDIASQYFDLRFDEENVYSNSYGYGRKYSHKPGCDSCEKDMRTWIKAFNGLIDKNQILALYYAKEIDLQCLSYKGGYCDGIPLEDYGRWFCDLLLSSSINDLIAIISKIDNYDFQYVSTIPQFSQLSDATRNVIGILLESGLQNVTFDKLGYYLGGKERNLVAKKKYGENHAKLSALLDLAVIQKVNNTAYIHPSIIGKAFHKLTDKDKDKLIARLILRIPIIQGILKKASISYTSIEEHMEMLSDETIKRRKPNIVTLLNYLDTNSESGLKEIYSHINGI